MKTRNMPKEIRKRQSGGEQARFVWAFEECLRQDPNKAPSPTDLNTVLENRPPLNILAGRLSKLRRTLLIKHGFTQTAKFNPWYKA